ncbi:MAG TPA: WG repeat-containing protein [Sphingobacterium sp.]|nr:WG repeat-containing protein [Sphingobacterium sp.]
MPKQIIRQLFIRATALLFLLTMSLPLIAQKEVSPFGMCSEEAWGFINVYDSTKRIPAIYCSSSGFSEGLAAVKKGEIWGYIDTGNNVVLDFQFDYARSFKQDRAIVKVGEFYGVINEDGEFVIPPCYYDLMPYELEGDRYYLSRDSTFFQGIIDSAGIEILPHRYTYIITYQPNLGQQRFYKNIPFYTVYQDIDTAKGSFFDQFKEDSYQFSPEKGRHDIYDLKFDKLASRNSTGYSDGFPHKELVKIDNFLDENIDLVAAQKVKEVANILDTKEQNNPEVLGSNNEGLRYGVMNHDEIEDHLAKLGYRLFTSKEGKIGVKKKGIVVIPAENKFLQLLNVVISAPMIADISYLQENYEGAYRPDGTGFFDLFCVVASGEGQEGFVYSLSGKQILNVDKKTMSLSNITKIGFKYSTNFEMSSSQYGLVGWDGETILSPLYEEIDVLRTGQLVVKQAEITDDGMKEYMGLFTEKGEVVIPLGEYSEIKPFQEVDNLYLAVQSDSHLVKKISTDKSKDYVVLKVSDNSYNVTNRFSANLIFTWALDPETGMIPYRQFRNE